MKNKNAYIQFLESQKEVIMQVPDLCLLGDSILREQAIFSDFQKAYDVCKELEVRLGKIRAIKGYGRGLAAPQIGSSERCFVTFVNDTYQYYINPEIIQYGDAKNRYKENCFSCGAIVVDVVRPESITLSYLNKENHDGFMARLLQHEYDHLEGILNISKTSVENLELLHSDPLEEKLRPYAHE